MGCSNFAKYHPNATLDQYCAKFGYDKGKLAKAVKNTPHYKEIKAKYKNSTEDEIIKQAAWALDRVKSDGKSMTDILYHDSSSRQAASSVDYHGPARRRGGGRRRIRSNFFQGSSTNYTTTGMTSVNEKLDDKTTIYYNTILGTEGFETQSTTLKLEYLKILKRISNKGAKSSYEREEFYKAYERVIYDFAARYNVHFSEENLRKLNEDELKYVAEVLKIIDDMEKSEKLLKNDELKKQKQERLSEKEAKTVEELIKTLKLDKKHAAYSLILKLIEFMIKQKIEKEDIVKKLSVFMKILKGESEKTQEKGLRCARAILSPLERKLLLEPAVENS